MTDPVGIVLVGHGDTASRLVEAARHIIPGDGLDGVMAVDAGDGESPELCSDICEALESSDRGRGVVLVVDLVGASPCNCAQREARKHRFVTVSGLNLAMLLKLGSLDRRAMEPLQLAQAAAESGRRAVTVEGEPDQGTTDP